MAAFRARVAAVWRHLRDAEPAKLIQYAATGVALVAAFGVAVPLGLDAKIAAGVTVAAFIRDLIVGRLTREAVWSPDSVARLRDAAKALGAPADKVDAVADLIASGQIQAVHELLVAHDPPGQHAAPEPG